VGAARILVDTLYLPAPPPPRRRVRAWLWRVKSLDISQQYWTFPIRHALSEFTKMIFRVPVTSCACSPFSQTGFCQSTFHHPTHRQWCVCISLLFSHKSGVSSGINPSLMLGLLSLSQGQRCLNSFTSPWCTEVGSIRRIRGLHSAPRSALMG